MGIKIIHFCLADIPKLAEKNESGIKAKIKKNINK
tara:strand:+ start:427 stop:531 length:105 start_codon:yes stop_codon:yes gene_type:complete